MACVTGRNFDRQDQRGYGWSYLYDYLFVRQVTVAFGINMSGMVAMVRPLIAPMSEAAVAQGRPSISTYS